MSSVNSSGVVVACYFPHERDWPKVNEGNFPLFRDVETEASGGSLSPGSYIGEEKR